LLFSEAQTFDYISVSLNIIISDVIEQSSSLTNQLQKPATGMMILLMGFEMFGQIFNSGAQKSDLHLWRPCIFVMYPVILN